MKLIGKFKVTSLILLAAILLQINACSEDETALTPGDSPTVPPQTSMVVDFTEFPDTNSPGPLFRLEPSDTILRGNWGWAAGHVWVWSTIIKVGMAIPVAAFVESFNHQPVQQPNGSWLWTYTLTISGINYTAKLYGTSVTNGIEWRMLLTKAGFYTDFEWFTGFSNTPATEGTWTLNKDPNDPVPFLLIEWSRNVEDNTAQVKYTNIVPNVPENGSYIHYGKTNEITYDRFFNIFGIAENRLINVEWNYKEHFGRVKDPQHFGSENWNCWDEMLFDTQCPE
ncbi:MAG: hypothetical protein KJN64_06405 [Ignavibacteria bacterium]|nr:hypothetical protein [Ignavibacteria bacterium]MBT8383964.1 hypothetical protein [Ignavibacteria bacterium]MBT8392575.1 hypothetical protein [Ignavibacteria bacterium]NNJ53799.1 hypothetical protein [Ignavibacteriaceae bacterium]NNL22124.1 hypothetical protein [Ignavibacteriaceae bacterium]